MTIYDTAVKRYKAAQSKQSEWREDARRAFDFVAGEQWEQEDLTVLMEQNRPAVTFNRVGVYVDGVAGLEKLNRMEIQYLPRGQTDMGVSNLMSSVSKYVYDDCNGYSEESEAFTEMVICGMGWTGTRMDYETNPEGDIEVSRVDPLEMVWDPSSRKRNLRDRRWQMRIKHNTSREEIEAMFPDLNWDELTPKAPWDMDSEDLAVHNDDLAPFYKSSPGEKGSASSIDTATLCDYQWVETESRYRVAAGNRMFTLTQKQYQQLMKIQPELRAVRIPFRRYYRAWFVGSQLAEREELPMGWTYECMTAKRKRRDNTWYGLVSALMDPQLWVNKFFSSIQYQIATQAKGGLMAEKGAFENDSEAETQWAKPDSIVWLNKGSLQGQNPKIKEKPIGQYPTGIDRLMQIAMDMFRDVSGMSLELLGLAEKNQPGVLEAQRKQAGMTILAWCFDALTDYRKNQGKLIIGFAREYLADGRLIRVASDDGQQQYIPVLKDQLSLEYDVIVTESPRSVNERERVFGLLSQLLPDLVNMGVPLPPDLIDYLPLPETLQQTWKQYIAQQQGQGQQQQEPKEDPVLTQAKAMELTEKAKHHAAKAQKEQIDTQLEIQETQSVVELNKAKAFREKGKGLVSE